MSNYDKLILVGIIVAAHGIKGNAIIKSFTDPITNIFSLPLINSKKEKVHLKLIKELNKGRVICKINNLQERNEIEKICNSKLYCLNSNLPSLQLEEFYIENLKNLKVLTPNSQEIGKITNIYNFGAGDVIEIKFQDNQIQLFPFTKEFFPNVTSNYVVLIKRF